MLGTRFGRGWTPLAALSGLRQHPRRSPQAIIKRATVANFAIAVRRCGVERSNSCATGFGGWPVRRSSGSTSGLSGCTWTSCHFASRTRGTGTAASRSSAAAAVRSRCGDWTGTRATMARRADGRRIPGGIPRNPTTAMGPDSWAPGQITLDSARAAGLRYTVAHRAGNSADAARQHVPLRRPGPEGHPRRGGTAAHPGRW